MYAIIKDIEIEPFDYCLKTAFPSIKFTYELEKSRQLTLLDINVQHLKDVPIARDNKAVAQWTTPADAASLCLHRNSSLLFPEGMLTSLTGQFCSIFLV